jgi:hypothetical protein
MAAQPIMPEISSREVSRQWIESHYVWIVQEALWGSTKPARLTVAANALDKLARFKGLVIEKQARLNVAVGQMDRAAIKAQAIEMLEQLEPGARAEMRRLLARPDPNTINDFTLSTDKDTDT